MSEATLLQSRGQPENKMSAGIKSIYEWPDLSVTVRNGKVESLRNINPQAKRDREAARSCDVGFKKFLRMRTPESPSRDVPNRARGRF